MAPLVSGYPAAENGHPVLRVAKVLLSHKWRSTIISRQLLAEQP